MGTRRKGDAKYFVLAWAVMTAIALPFVLGFGYLAGGVPWGICAAAATACCLAVSWTVIARR